MTGLVAVSHSRPLAEAVVGLATGLIPGLDVKVDIAAGMPDGGLGTDATAILEAIETVDDGEGVLVLADLGSGIMSAQMALELLDPDKADRVKLSPGALVEGFFAAYAAAGTGQSFEQVCAEAEKAATAKREQVLGEA